MSACRPDNCTAPCGYVITCVGWLRIVQLHVMSGSLHPVQRLGFDTLVRPNVTIKKPRTQFYLKFRNLKVIMCNIWNSASNSTKKCSVTFGILPLIQQKNALCIHYKGRSFWCGTRESEIRYMGRMQSFLVLKQRAHTVTLVFKGLVVISYYLTLSFSEESDRSVKLTVSASCLEVNWRNYSHIP
jgi:hypothetical protein